MKSLGFVWLGGLAAVVGGLMWVVKGGSILPLVMGLGAPLLILAGGILALINERLLEVPIVLVVKSATVQPSARVR
jgi:hypothetical protein